MSKLLVIVGSTRPGRAADLVTPWVISRARAPKHAVLGDHVHQLAVEADAGPLPGQRGADQDQPVQQRDAPVPLTSLSTSTHRLVARAPGDGPGRRARGAAISAAQPGQAHPSLVAAAVSGHSGAGSSG